MTHLLSNLKVRTLTIISGNVPSSNKFRHVPPHLSTKPCLNMTSFDNRLLQKIEMIHPLSNIRVRTLTINSGDVPSPSNIFGHVPPPPHLTLKPCLDMISFGNLLLLKIAMTHPLSNIIIRNLNINRGDVTLLPRTCLGSYPFPLPIKLVLDMTSFGNLLLLFIAMTHILSNLKVRTLAINSGDVPPSNKFEHVPFPAINQTLSRHDVIWISTVTKNSNDSSIVLHKKTYYYF